MKTIPLVLVAGAFVLAVCGSAAGGEQAAATSLRTCAPMASYRAFLLRGCEKYYVHSLRHPITGVVESALREFVLLRMTHPDESCAEIREALEELSSRSDAPAVRFKATLARMVDDNPRMFRAEAEREYFTDDEVFTAIARRLEMEYLAARAE